MSKQEDYIVSRFIPYIASSTFYVVEAPIYSTRDSSFGDSLKDFVKALIEESTNEGRAYYSKQLLLVANKIAPSLGSVYILEAISELDLESLKPWGGDELGNCVTMLGSENGHSKFK